MSIQVLGKVGKLHTVQDDLESFLWVTLYGTVRYVGTSASIHNLGAAMCSVFDHFTAVNSKVVRGGQHKVDFLLSIEPFKKHLQGLNNANLASLVRLLRSVFLLYYSYLTQVSGTASLLMDDAAVSEESAVQQAFAKHSMDDLDAKNHDKMEQLFKEALNKDGWPVDDASQDNLAQDSPLLSLPVPVTTKDVSYE